MLRRWKSVVVGWMALLLSGVEEKGEVGHEGERDAVSGGNEIRVAREGGAGGTKSKYLVEADDVENG